MSTEPKIIETILPALPRAAWKYRVRCLEFQCGLATLPEPRPSSSEGRLYARAHAERTGHAVVIEELP